MWNIEISGSAPGFRPTLVRQAGVPVAYLTEQGAAYEAAAMELVASQFKAAQGFSFRAVPQ